MRFADYVRLAFGAVIAHRLRSGLTALGIAVGVAAVVLLTSVGQGVHQFVLSEFTQFGTTILSVNPGRKTTMGHTIGIFGTDRPLTIDDVEVLRRVPYVISTEGLVQGNAIVEHGNRSRRVTVLGVGADMPRILQFEVELGRFLPPDDPRRARAFVVLGAKVSEELFPGKSPIGQRVRVGGDRYTAVGVMEAKGQFLGLDLDDTVYVPAARGLELFDREGLMEGHVLYGPEAPVEEVIAGVERVLIARHGREDFTITTQDQMLETLSGVLAVLTLAAGALGGISLFVGGVGILTITTLAVRERTSEVGLLRTLGARRGQVLGLFLLEAVVVSALGGGVGLAFGAGLGRVLAWLVPTLPVATPWSFALAAEGMAIVLGLTAGVLPSWRAANLDPVDALRSE